MVDRVVMLGLVTFVIIITGLRLRTRTGRLEGRIMVVSFAWLLLLDVVAQSEVVPPQVGVGPFLAAVVAVVGAFGLALATLRGDVERLLDADLLLLQGPRVLFGAFFIIQAVTGSLPRQFGFIDGLTHLSAGALGLAAARAAKTERAPWLAWLANLFGLVDIVVVLSSLSFVLLPEITTRHPMMYAVFAAAPSWAWWHLLSLKRLVITARRRTPAPQA